MQQEPDLQSYIQKGIEEKAAPGSDYLCTVHQLLEQKKNAEEIESAFTNLLLSPPVQDQLTPTQKNAVLAFGLRFLQSFPQDMQGIRFIEDARAYIPLARFIPAAHPELQAEAFTASSAKASRRLP